MFEVRRFGAGRAIGLGVLFSFDSFIGFSLALLVIQINVGVKR